MCTGRVAVIQAINDPALDFCPDCGMQVRRILSSVSFRVSGVSKLGKAGERGFTTWKKSGAGTWEKVSGPGANVILADPKATSAPEPSPTRPVLDLDDQ
jgi:predicted nucleic acid-binding Zn ribbon protein